MLGLLYICLRFNERRVGVILGKWVSNYKQGDKVIFITKDFNVRDGLIYFPDGLNFSENYTIYSENKPYSKDDIKVLCNSQDNDYYVINKNELYKALFESLEKKIEQAECNHSWVGESENQQCSKCLKWD